MNLAMKLPLTDTTRVVSLKRVNRRRILEEACCLATKAEPSYAIDISCQRAAHVGNIADKHQIRVEFITCCTPSCPSSSLSTYRPAARLSSQLFFSHSIFSPPPLPAEVHNSLIFPTTLFFFKPAFILLFFFNYLRVMLG